MECLPAADDVFGPQVHGCRHFDFTLLGIRTDHPTSRGIEFALAVSPTQDMVSPEADPKAHALQYDHPQAVSVCSHCLLAASRVHVSWLKVPLIL
jgi:hypothetical protein